MYTIFYYNIINLISLISVFCMFSSFIFLITLFGLKKLNLFTKKFISIGFFISLLITIGFLDIKKPHNTSVISINIKKAD